MPLKSINQSIKRKNNTELGVVSKEDTAFVEFFCIPKIFSLRNYDWDHNFFFKLAQTRLGNSVDI